MQQIIFNRNTPIYVSNDPLSYGNLLLFPYSELFAIVSVSRSDEVEPMQPKKLVLSSSGNSPQPVHHWISASNL